MRKTIYIPLVYIFLDQERQKEFQKLHLRSTRYLLQPKDKGEEVSMAGDKTRKGQDTVPCG